MTAPGGAGTIPRTVFDNSFVLGATGFYLGSELPRARLRPFALPRSCALKTLLWTLTTFKGEGVMVRLASEGLRSVGASSPSKSACSILPLARRWRAGETFRELTPARGSLLKPAADQQVQPPINRQGAYHRQPCEYPEEHSEHGLPSLACCRVQHNRYPQ